MPESNFTGNAAQTGDPDIYKSTVVSPTPRIMKGGDTLLATPTLHLGAGSECAAFESGVTKES